MDRPIELVYIAPDPAGAHLLPSVRPISYTQLAELNHRRYSDAWDLFRSLLIPVLR